MSAIIPFIEGCFIISHDASIHPVRCGAGPAAASTSAAAPWAACCRVGWCQAPPLVSSAIQIEMVAATMVVTTT